MLTSKSAPNKARPRGVRGLSNPIAEQRFREIVPPLLDDAYSLAKWLSHSPTDAEDIVQDAALRALQALSSISVDRPKPWFLAIVRNAAMTFMARNRRKTVAYAGDMTDLDGLDLRRAMRRRPTRTGAHRLRRQRALASGDREPSPALSGNAGDARHQRPLYREIAEATETPVGTVMSRLARARAMLARTLRTKS